MATLSYEIENLSKNQFEILSEGRSTSLQASSNEAMMYWLTQLQVQLTTSKGIGIIPVHIKGFVCCIGRKEMVCVLV